MTKPILLIDNNDSFTMNIRQIVNELGFQVEITNYLELQTSDVTNFDKIIISPGPGHPTEYTKYYAVFDLYKSHKSFLGICLGLQIIGQYFGAKLRQSFPIEHGKQSQNIIISSSTILEGIPNNTQIGRYHSWCLDKKTIPQELIINSVSEDDEIMCISHKSYSIYGVQFHPESYITQFGSKILENWITKV